MGRLIRQKDILLYTTILCSLALFQSCNRKDQIKNEIRKLQSQPICIDLSKESYIAIDSMLVNNIELCPYLFVEYIAKDDCSSCKLNGLYLWEIYLQDLQTRGIYVNAIVIINASNNNIEKLRKQIFDMHLHIPIILDVSDTFVSDNNNLSDRMIFKTFLLDKDRNVRIVGSPIDNHRLTSVINDYFKTNAF